MQRSSCIHKNIHQLVTHSYDSHSSQIKNFLEFYLSVENGKNRELDAFNQLVAGKEKGSEYMLNITQKISKNVLYTTDFK
jgi:hypothetical protein